MLAALAAEIAKSATKTNKARNLLMGLGKRIDWAKAIRLAATSSLTLQIPDFDKLIELVKLNEGDEDSVRGLSAAWLVTPEHSVPSRSKTPSPSRHGVD